MNDPHPQSTRSTPEGPRPSIPLFPLAIGLILVASGALLMLEKWNVIDLSWSPWDLWPVLLIVAGLQKLLDGGEQRRTGLGLVLVLAGSLILLSNLDILRVELELWPILIVLAGIMVLYGAFKPRCHRGREHTPQNCSTEAPSQAHARPERHLNLSTIMGGGEYRFDHPNLEGGRISAVMGGFSLDLRHTHLAQRTVSIDIHVIMGGVELTVPSDWEVSLEGTPILGGLDNKTVRPASPAGHLRVIGTVLMGAVEVKN